MIGWRELLAKNVAFKLRSQCACEASLEARRRKIQVYETPEGFAPFDEWLLALRDSVARTRIRVRLDRFREGNAGDSKSVGAGVFELRLDFGPGYRVYFAESGLEIVILLIGGEKSTQAGDIRLAQHYWQEFKERS